MKKQKITILEDELIIAMHLQELLESEGYHIQNVFHSGEELLANNGAENTDILLVDIILSGELDGIETVKKLQKKQDVCVIYLTGNSNQSTIEQTFSTFSSGFLKKPFNPYQLTGEIEATYKKYLQEKSCQPTLQ